MLRECCENVQDRNKVFDVSNDLLVLKHTLCLYVHMSLFLRIVLFCSVLFSSHYSASS